MITLDQAQTIVAATLAHGVAAGMKPLSALVVDAGGHPIAFARSDGSSPGRFAIAEGKAYGAVMLGIGGTAQQARADAQAYFMACANGVFGGKVLPVQGGVLIRAGGAVVGALGVTGDTSENDRIAGEAGIVAAGLDAEG